MHLLIDVVLAIIILISASLMFYNRYRNTDLFTAFGLITCIAGLVMIWT